MPNLSVRHNYHDANRWMDVLASRRVGKSRPHYKGREYNAWFLKYLKETHSIIEEDLCVNVEGKPKLF